MNINLFWFLLMLPIITIPPAFAGLYYATSRLAQNEPANRKVFFEGFKKYFKVSYGWFFLNLIAIGILLFNIDLSSRVSVTWLRNLTGLYWVILGFWLLLQIYTFPFLIKQDEPKLFLALRNSVLIWLKRSFFSLFLTILIAILIVISRYAFPFWILITASLISYLSNLGLVLLLSKEKLSANDE